MNAIEVIHKIEKGSLENCYLLIGQEMFFHDQVIHALEKQIFKDSSSRSLNRIVLNGPETNLAEIVNASMAYPMLSDLKMVLVKDFNRVGQADQDIFLKYLSAPQKASILVLRLVEAGRNAFYKKVSSLTQVVDCKPVREYHMMPWAKKMIKEKNLKIDPPALNMLLEYTGANLLALTNEIEKLKNFKLDQAEINTDDVIALTGMSKEFNVFTFQDAVSQKDFRNAMKIGSKLLENGSNINALIGLLFAHFRRILLIADLKKRMDIASIKSKLHIKDFQWNKLNAALQNFSIHQLGRVINQLQTCDRRIKNSQGSAEAILQDFIFFICKK